MSFIVIHLKSQTVEHKGFPQAPFTRLKHFLDSLKGGIISYMTWNLQSLAKCQANGGNLIRACSINEVSEIVPGTG